METYFVAFTDKKHTQHFSYKADLSPVQYAALTNKLKTLGVPFEVVKEKFYETASFAAVIEHIDNM